jgi:hypothetical protein
VEVVEIRRDSRLLSIGLGDDGVVLGFGIEGDEITGFLFYVAGFFEQVREKRKVWVEGGLLLFSEAAKLQESPEESGLLLNPRRFIALVIDHWV